MQETQTSIDNAFVKKPVGQFTAREVDAAFCDFRDTFSSRGGIVRHDKSPYNPPSEVVLIGLSLIQESQKTSERLHVESSFTREQDYYGRLAFACLTSMALGQEELSGQPNETESFADMIVKRYRSGTNMEFGDAVESSVCELVGKFLKKYPEFTPAMEKLMEWAGYGGFVQVLKESANLRYSAFYKQFTEEDMKVYGGLPKRDFVGLHPSNSGIRDTVANFEIWCTGETLGRTLIHQSALAALRLAEDPRVEEVRYAGFFVPIKKYDKNLRKKIGASIRTRMEQLRVANAI